MRVPYSYLEPQFADIDGYLNDVKDFVKTGDFTLGAKLEEFESKFAAFTGVKHAIGVNSGTDALILSMKALGIGPGDEVITCVETFIATHGAIAATGARPVFVDSTEEFLIDCDQIEKVITDKTKAIVPIWFTGNAPDMERILAIAEKHNLKVVEDSCCGIDASIDGKKAGSFGDTGSFSFHPLKNLNVWSDAGMIITNDGALNDKLRLLRNHGLATRDEVDIYGVNSRMDTFQAVIALRLFPQVPAITDARIANAAQIDEGLKNVKQVTVPIRDPKVRQNYHLYMLRVEDRDALQKHLVDKEIEAKVHYPIPLHLQKCAARLGYKKGGFPVCEKHAAEIISLPVHQHLGPEQVDFMIDNIKSFYKKG
ncbi:MAG: DegT/DnrJ/EryC1/StrS family aminotransferase [Candidatus Omnitrophica bacterium]|nr:DegT/DnrJ/EryC1/StrS family aminotransferase [Candidatus Omnitrophota bacterium]